MSLAQTLADITVDEYLAGERQSEIKHEYVGGKVFAMAGASLNHNRISRNLLTLISAQLPASCEVFSSDLLVKTRLNRFRYPDVVVLCEDVEGSTQFIEHPVLIVEILSKSTRQQDKGMKRTEYLSLPSLQEYVLIEQDFVEVEVLRRTQGWRSENFYLGDVVQLESIGVALSVVDIYQRVDNAEIVEYLAKAQAHQHESTHDVNGIEKP